MNRWLKPPGAAERMLRWLGLLWAAPVTLCGVIPAIAIVLTGGRWQRISEGPPAWLIQGSFGDWLLKHHPVGSVNAMAIGHLVIAQRAQITQRILRHELQHVRQAACWGVLFPLVYLMASVWAIARGGRGYWDNWFEIAARRAEGCQG